MKEWSVEGKNILIKCIPFCVFRHMYVIRYAIFTSERYNSLRIYNIILRSAKQNLLLINGIFITNISINQI